jgi:hypothetical protein
MQSSAIRTTKSKAQTHAAANVATYRHIEDLQGAGINVSDIKKLEEAGLHTIGSVLQCATRDLIAIKGDQFKYNVSISVSARFIK